jgi:hypothetical protein
MDHLEQLGALVDSGVMSEADAVSRLVEAWDGGLTEYGAATLLPRWQTARADMERAIATDLRRLGGGS